MCPPSRRDNDGESDYPNRQIDKSKPRPLQSNLFVKALCQIKIKQEPKRANKILIKIPTGLIDLSKSKKKPFLIITFTKPY